MLAVTVTPGGSPALRELPSPTTPPGGVLVRVRACGLCGSDVEKLRPGGAPAGTVLGHEIAGVVVDGALPAGLRVALAHHVPCGTCAHCLRGPRAALPRLRRQRARARRVLRADRGLERARRPRRAAAARSRERSGRLVRRAPGLRAARHRGALRRRRPGGRRGLDRPARRAGPACARRRRCGCWSPSRRARGAPPSSASRHPRDGERFGGALLSAAGAFADALPLLEPGGQLVLFSGGAAAAARRRRSSTAASSSCAGCDRPRRATCARRWP